jgi:hypothetical protein
MKGDPMNEINTWGELYKALRDAGYGDDEYINPSYHYDDKNADQQPIWDTYVRYIACFWVVGNSEGYYVHIDRVLAKDIYKGVRELVPQTMILGKFWQWERAQECANFAQRLVNR